MRIHNTGKTTVGLLGPSPGLDEGTHLRGGGNGDVVWRANGGRFARGHAHQLSRLLLLRSGRGRHVHTAAGVEKHNSQPQSRHSSVPAPDPSSIRQQ
jgi:hypothetical protein